MVTRNELTPSALVVGLCAGLLAQHATAAEAVVVHKAPAVAEVRVDAPTFRSEIDSYIRVHNEQLRLTLDKDLRPVAPKIELASNELRARG